MDVNILHKHLQAASRLPRYTSYPTAPHFSDTVGSDMACDWLGKVGENTHNASLYIHIPFCAKLCLFCGCHMKVVNTYSPVQQYLQVLEQEVALVVKTLNSNKTSCPPISHVHFGGGSPTSLEAQDFKNFMGLLKRSFPINDTADLAIEIDPRTVDMDKMTAYTQSGINRISIGVQDFNPTVQKAVNRVQPFSMVQGVVDIFRQQGVKSVNMDIMYGLPFQTVDTIKHTIQQVLELSPDRLSVFGYAHVPWMKPHQRLIPEEALAGLEERLNMFEAIRSILEAGGYTAVGLDHFAKTTDSMTHALKTGMLHRNFQGYTTDKAESLIGLGHTSIGYTPDGYLQNTGDPTAYKKAITEGKLPIKRGYQLSPDDITRRRIINIIMCSMYVDLTAFGGVQAYQAEISYLHPLINDNIITLQGNTLTLHPPYRALLRVFASAFDVYHTAQENRPAQENRHSLSV